MTPLDPEWETLVRAVRRRAKLVGELQRLPASAATLDRLLQEQVEGERLAVRLRQLRAAAAAEFTRLQKERVRLQAQAATPPAAPLRADYQG